MTSTGISSQMSPTVNSMDWFAQQQMQQMPQMAAYGQQMHGQQISYDQLSLEHQMMAQRNGQGTLYMRSPRAAQEPGYSGSVTLVIQCLPPHADVALLHDLCAPYGRILSAQIDVDTTMRQEPNRPGVCSGRGRVQMAGLAQAQYATQALNGAIIFEGGRPLQVSIAYSGGRQLELQGGR
jgi:hypothetical protein